MQPTIRRSCCNCRQRKDKGGDEEIPKRMTVKHTLISLDMRVFALCSLMELHRRKGKATVEIKEYGENDEHSHRTYNRSIQFSSNGRIAYF